MNKSNYNDAFCLAYGTGRQKKWAKEKLIIECLYETYTQKQYPFYLKIKDINLLGQCNNQDEEYFKYSFGYLFRFPKTQIDLCVNIKKGQMFLEKVGIGFGYEEVEKEVYKFIEKQIKLKNVYYKTSLNNEEFLVR